MAAPVVDDFPLEKLKKMIEPFSAAQSKIYSLLTDGPASDLIAEFVQHSEFWTKLLAFLASCEAIVAEETLNGDPSNVTGTSMAYVVDTVGVLALELERFLRSVDDLAKQYDMDTDDDTDGDDGEAADDGDKRKELITLVEPLYCCDRVMRADGTISYLEKFRKPALTVDVVICLNPAADEEARRFVLVKRGPDTQPAIFANTFAIPGGFKNAGENLHEAAIREALNEETNAGLDHFEEFYELGVASHPTRDPRQETVSVVYIAEASSDIGDLATNDPSEIAGISILRIPQIRELHYQGKIAFDHYSILLAANQTIGTRHRLRTLLTDKLPLDDAKEAARLLHLLDTLRKLVNLSDPVMIEISTLDVSK